MAPGAVVGGVSEDVSAVRLGTIPLGVEQGPVKAVGSRFTAVLLVLFLVGLALPVESSFLVGTLRLTPYRAFLIVMIVPCLFLLLSGRVGRVRPIDQLIGLHCAWVVAAMILWGGIALAWEPGGIYAVEALGSYLVARCFIRGHEGLSPGLPDRLLADRGHASFRCPGIAFRRPFHPRGFPVALRRSGSEL